MSDKLQGGIKAGSTDVSLPVELRSSTNSTALTGKAFGDITGSYWRQGGSRVAITMATQTVDGAHSDGGFVEVDAANMAGVYRLDLPDAAVATGADWVVVSLKCTGAFQQNFYLPLTTNVVQSADAPTSGAIADAVWDEVLSGHLTAGTTGAALSAANAPTASAIADAVWEETVPAAYADGTAGAAVGRLNNTPAAAPVTIVPDPDDDSAVSVVYGYTENIANVKRSGIIVRFSVTSKPLKSERILEVASQIATTDADGFFSITLQRDIQYLVECPELGLKHIFTPTGDTFDILTLI